MQRKGVKNFGPLSKFVIHKAFGTLKSHAKFYELDMETVIKKFNAGIPPYIIFTKEMYNEKFKRSPDIVKTELEKMDLKIEGEQDLPNAESLRAFMSKNNWYC